MTPARSGPGAQRLHELLEPHAASSPAADSAGAAVLIVLRAADGAADVDVLLIERSVRDGDPGSGQVSLPGGHVDAGDPSLGATALREAEEEVGIGPSDLAEPPRYLGTELARAFGLFVGIFAAPLRSSGRAPHPHARDEVADVFWLPSRELARTVVVDRDTRQGRIAVEAAVFEGHVVWGFTRRILCRFFGLEAPAAGPSAISAPTASPNAPVP